MFDVPDIYLVWHAVYIVVTLPIIIGNALIITSIIKFRKLQTTMNVLVANLAFADLIVGAILIPFDVVGDVTGLNDEKYFCLGKYSMFVLSLGSSNFNLLLISIERFVAVMFPLRKERYFTKTRLILMISIGWSISVIDGVLPLLGWSNYSENKTDCVPDVVWTSSYTLFNDLLFVTMYVVNVTCYVTVMYIAVKKARSTVISGNIYVHANRTKDMNNLKTMIMILGLFVVCWFPYVCMDVIVTFNKSAHLLFIRRCTLIPGMVNSSLNWLVYGYRNKDFRTAFWTLLVCRRFRTRQNSEHNVGPSAT